MKGAEALIKAAVDAGIRVCFANPGTTELPLVLALDTTSSLRGILCLHENVATGAADGYGRMTGKPAMCLLHLGPGLANGLTNLHNARRAMTPIVNVLGEHATWHRTADPLLATNIEDMARTVSDFVRENKAPASMASDMVETIAAARSGGGRIATIIVPHDHQIADVTGTSIETKAFERPRFEEGRVFEAAKCLKRGRAAILLGGAALTEAGLKLAGRISSATGAPLLCDTFFARMERGAGLPAVTKLPYFPDVALKLTRRFERVVIAGTRRPVAFFGYPGLPSYLTSEEQTVMLAEARDDVLGALSALVAELNAPDDCRHVAVQRPDVEGSLLDASTVSAVIAQLQPENSIVMDEALTVGVPYFDSSRTAPRFTHLMLTGGAIGEGPGAAVGAAVACPNRKVVNFQSDGCGAYSVQALWTQAREALDVVTIIGANRSYNILNVELERAGITAPGPATRSMASLGYPNLDWVKIGEGFGVPSVAVRTPKELACELEKALSQRGPCLIEALMT